MPAIVATRVFHNGRIYTVDEQRSWAEAIAIADGKIIFVGADADITGAKVQLTLLEGEEVFSRQSP